MNVRYFSVIFYKTLCFKSLLLKNLMVITDVKNKMCDNIRITIFGTIIT